MDEQANSQFWVKYMPKSFFGSEIGNKDLHQIVNNTAWLLVDKVARLLITLFIGAWVARYLGPNDFGSLSFVLAYILIFQVITVFGLDGIVVRELSNDPNKANKILPTVFFIRLSLGLICWVSVGIFSAINYGYDSEFTKLIVIIGATLVFQSAETIDLFFQSKSQSSRTVIVKLMTYLLLNTSRIIMIQINAPLEAFAFLVAIESAVIALGLMVVFKKECVVNCLQFSPEIFLKLIHEAWPYVVIGVFVVIQSRIEFFLIKDILGLNLLGQYVAALNLIAMFDVIGVAFIVSVFPKIVNISIEKREQYYKKIYRLMFTLYAVLLPFIFALWLLIMKLYGPEYELAQEIFIFMLLRPLFTFIAIVRNMAITIDKKNIYLLMTTLCGIGASVLFGTLLIPPYGLYGAIAASTLGYFLSLVAMDIIFYKNNIKNMNPFHHRDLL